MTITTQQAKVIMDTLWLKYIQEAKELRELVRSAEFNPQTHFGGATLAQVLSSRLEGFMNEYASNPLADVCGQYNIAIGDDVTPSEALGAHLEQRLADHDKEANKEQSTLEQVNDALKEINEYLRDNNYPMVMVTYLHNGLDSGEHPNDRYMEIDTDICNLHADETNQGAARFYSGEEHDRWGVIADKDFVLHIGSNMRIRTPAGSCLFDMEIKANGNVNWSNCSMTAEEANA